MMAWLHATPKPPEGSLRAAAGRPTFSRLNQLKANKIAPQMPPNPLPLVIDRLIEIGLNEAAGMGTVPISWREINEWQRATGVNLPAWEARLIRRLSIAYLTEGRRAEAEACPPPWRGEVSLREQEVERERLRMVLG